MCTSTALAFGNAGSIIIQILVLVVSLILLTQKSFFGFLFSVGAKLRSSMDESRTRREEMEPERELKRELREKRREEQQKMREEQRLVREQQRREKQEMRMQQMKEELAAREEGPELYDLEGDWKKKKHVLRMR